jgi:hypothetical protein
MTDLLIFWAGGIAWLAHCYLTTDSDHWVVAFTVDGSDWQGNSFDPGAQLKLGGAANAILGWLCACEAQATRRGWSPWLGGSVPDVARKVY